MKVFLALYYDLFSTSGAFIFHYLTLEIKITKNINIDAVSSASEKYYALRRLTSRVINGKEIDTTHLHLKKWIDCIRDGAETSTNIKKTFEEGGTVLLAQKSYLEKRRVE